MKNRIQGVEGTRVPVKGDGHQRSYRNRAGCAGLVSFKVVCQETDLMIQADRWLEIEARERVLHYRGHIEGYIQRFPEFATILVPWQAPALAPLIVREMIQAGRAAGVGPMAAVAGAMAEAVGRDLLTVSRQVVVENGGDLFIKSDGPLVVGIFAGQSPLSMKIGIRLPGAVDGVGLCTSSATVGHSLSIGSADAVCVVARPCALADAAATAIGNRVVSPADIRSAIAWGQDIPGVMGMVLVTGRQMGAWGSLEIISLP